MPCRPSRDTFREAPLRRGLSSPLEQAQRVPLCGRSREQAYAAWQACPMTSRGLAPSALPAQARLPCGCRVGSQASVRPQSCQGCRWLRPLARHPRQSFLAACSVRLLVRWQRAARGRYRVVVAGVCQYASRSVRQPLCMPPRAQSPSNAGAIAHAAPCARFPPWPTAHRPVHAPGRSGSSVRRGGACQTVAARARSPVCPAVHRW